MKIHRMVLAGALVAGSSAFGVAGVAHADTPDTMSAEVKSSVNVDTYWTAERMANAKSADALVEGKSGSGTAEATRHVQHASDSAPQLRANQETPVDNIGKVFFTLGGSDYVCSGNVVTADNKSVVATAGHCVNGGDENNGEFATNWVFVPGYENGDAPHGKWEASELFTSNEWASSGNITYDVGFAVMGEQNGSTIEDAVGATGIEFGAERGQSYDAFGYPAAAPFDGETLQSCSGSATDDPQGTGSQGIPCDMTGGSSGGPWFLSNGNQNSVNSYGYNGIEQMFGPYYGDVANDVYNDAAGSDGSGDDGGDGGDDDGGDDDWWDGWW